MQKQSLRCHKTSNYETHTQHILNLLVNVLISFLNFSFSFIKIHLVWQSRSSKIRFKCRNQNKRGGKPTFWQKKSDFAKTILDIKNVLVPAGEFFRVRREENDKTQMDLNSKVFSRKSECP